MPGLMNGSRRARMTPSIVNYHQVGIKSGLAPKATGPAVMFRAYNIGGAQQFPTVPYNVRGYAAQVAYLKANKLVSVNPAGSATVGRKYPIARMNFI